MNARSRGAEAEDRAAIHLLKLGYTVITRRCHVGRFELDLVALDGATLVFVEVKWRTGKFAVAEESLSSTKVQRLQEASERYMLENFGELRPARFDLIAIDDDGLRHHISAISNE